MAPEIKETPQVNNYNPFGSVSIPRDFDFTKINLFNPDDVLRARLEYVKKYNEPIKDEIAEGHRLIDNSRHELGILKRLYRNCDDEAMKLQLKSQIGDERQNLWTLCCQNCRRAFSLKRV